MIDAIAVRRFNHNGDHFAKDQRITLDAGTFAALAGINLVRKAPKLKLPAKQ